MENKKILSEINQNIPNVLIKPQHEKLRSSLALSIKEAHNLIRSARREAESMRPEINPIIIQKSQSVPNSPSDIIVIVKNNDENNNNNNTKIINESPQLHIKLLNEQNQELKKENIKLRKELLHAQQDISSLRKQLTVASQRNMETPSPFSISPQSICESRSFLEITPTKTSDDENKLDAVTPEVLQFTEHSSTIYSSSPANDITPETKKHHRKTSSAVKIQAVFRGHLERAAISHERQLSDIPLDSPSTPLPLLRHKKISDVDITPSNNNVRKKIDWNNITPPSSIKKNTKIPKFSSGREKQQNSAKSKRSYSLDREPMRKRRTPARRRKRNKGTTNSIKKSTSTLNLADTKVITPLTRLRSGSTPNDSTPQRNTPMLSRTLESPLHKLLSRDCTNTDIEDNDNDSDDSGVSSLSNGIQTFTPLDDAHIIKNLLNELRQHRKVIKTVDPNWSLRVNAMNSLEQLIRDPTQSLVLLPSWWTELDILKKCIAEQLEDLRSSIVREACRLVVSIAQTCGRTKECGDVAAFLLPVLFKRLYVTIKVISQSSDECIKQLLKNTLIHRCIPRLLKGTKDSHNPVRKGCGNYLTIILSKDVLASVEVHALDNYADKIGKCIIKCVDDSDKDVRKSFRNAFKAYRSKWNNHGENVWKKLSDSAKRAIDREK